MRRAYSTPSLALRPSVEFSDAYQIWEQTMKTLIGVLSAGLLVACTYGSFAGETETAPSLEGTSWIFEGNSLVDIWAEPIGDEPLTLAFKDGRVNGSAGCNTFFGEYKQEGTRLEFGELGSTRILCEDDIQHQEDVILEALERVTTFEINEVLMHMDTGSGSALVYRRYWQNEQIIDHGGLHTFETCENTGGTVNDTRTECRIDGQVLKKAW